MTRERFEELAGAYGGDLARWPAAEREAAALLAAAEPAFAGPLLERESGLDLTLAAAPRVVASRDLFERIVASGPAARRPSRWRAWFTPAALSGALAAAAAAGVVLGVQLGEQSGLSREASAQAMAALDVSAIPEEG